VVEDGRIVDRFLHQNLGTARLLDITG